MRSSISSIPNPAKVLTRRYETALRRFLKQGQEAADSQPAVKLGRQAVALGLETLDLALIHEKALLEQVLPVNAHSAREQLLQRAGLFFAEAITPLEEGHQGAHAPMNSAKRITVLLAEDHMIVREGLKKLLESESDIEVVGEATTGRQAVELNQKLHPAVIVMDIAMPQMNGLEATRQILKDFPCVRVLILSAHSDDAYVENATALGAAGYLIKQTSAHFLSEAIREVHKGNTFFSSTVAKRLLKRKGESLGRKGLPRASATRLSSREVEVLQLIAEGEANKQIAETLSISIKTVEKHRDHLMRKLDIHDTAGLTRYAIEAGIIESSVQLTIV